MYTSLNGSEGIWELITLIKDAALVHLPSGSFLAMVNFVSSFEIALQEGKSLFQKYILEEHVIVGDGYWTWSYRAFGSCLKKALKQPIATRFF